MDKDKKAKAITKALGYAENGGKPTTPKEGKTGEMKSIFQFTPKTWAAYSKQVLGKDNVPLDNDTETYVVHQKVKGWLDKGYTTEQIASMWNAGTGEPDAYTGQFSDGSPSIAVNKRYGVKFDVPAYAKKVKSYADSFEKGDNQPNQGKNQAESGIRSLLQTAGVTFDSTANTTPSIKPVSQQANTGLLQTLAMKK